MFYLILRFILKWTTNLIWCNAFKSCSLVSKVIQYSSILMSNHYLNTKKFVGKSFQTIPKFLKHISFIPSSVKLDNTFLIHIWGESFVINTESQRFQIEKGNSIQLLVMAHFICFYGNFIYNETNTSISFLWTHMQLNHTHKGPSPGV